MTRQMFILDGVNAATKETLKNAAMKRFGKPNASLMVRALIADFIALEVTGVKFDGKEAMEKSKEFADQWGRVQLSLPRDAIEALTLKAEDRLTSLQHYVANLMMTDLGSPQLLVDEMETLMASNLQLVRIGTNLNQLTKALKILVKSGQVVTDGALKTKPIETMAAEIFEHSKAVSDFIIKRRILVEDKGQGRGIKKLTEGE